MEKCIRCGKYHDVCPQGAIRPDSKNPELRKHRFGGPRRGFGFGKGRRL